MNHFSCIAPQGKNCVVWTQPKSDWVAPSRTPEDRIRPSRYRSRTCLPTTYGLLDPERAAQRRFQPAVQGFGRHFLILQPDCGLMTNNFRSSKEMVGFMVTNLHLSGFWNAFLIIDLSEKTDSAVSFAWSIFDAKQILKFRIIDILWLIYSLLFRTKY